MATPVVAGAAALYINHVGYVGPAQVEKALLAATNKCPSKDCGKGIIDVSKLLASVGSLKFEAWTYHIEYDEEYEYWYDSWDNYIGNSDNLANLKLSNDMLLYLYSTEADYYSKVVYTLDGSTPSVTNDGVKNGIRGNVIYLGDFHLGDTVTLKALYVTGLGKVSKVSTWTFTIAPQTPDSDELSEAEVRVLAPKTLIPGKAVTLSAVLGSPYTEEGYYELDQTFTWKIVSNSGCPSAKIDAKTGKLTTKAGETGSVTVRATSAKYSGKYKNVKIPVSQINPIGTIKLNQTSISAMTYEWRYIEIDTLQDNKKNDVAPESRSYRWTSSNPKVVRIMQPDSYGCEIMTVGKGSATITCEVLDGSGKKATCKVTVAQNAWDISISGQTSIAAGNSATYKATLSPKDAKENVTWSIVSAPAGVTIDPAKGIVKVPANVKSGSIQIEACTWYTDSTFNITIVPTKATSVSIYDYYRYGSASYPLVTKSKGVVTAVSLYSNYTSYTSEEKYERVIYLYGKASNGAGLVWTSSNPKVATVRSFSDGHCYVYGQSAGSATITCAAQDGSGKKATCKVTVINPVSQIFVKSKNPCFFEQDDIFLAGIGKSAGNTAVFGTTFGTPTNKKVTWSFEVYQEVWEGIGEYSTRTNITSQAKNNGWVKLSTSGSLTVDKKIQSKWESTVNAGKFLVIYVHATSQDGTNVTGTARYVVTPLTQKLSTSLPDSAKNTITLKVNNYTRYFYVYNDLGGYYGDYTITSSNPDIAAAVVDTHYLDGIYVMVLSGTKTGTAKITFKANDGSNKSITVTVKVTN